MDFEAPPPFTGALEEPPDMECDVRMTVDDDDEDDDIIQPPGVPIDVPCTSSPTFYPPIPPVTKRKSLDLDPASPSSRSTADDLSHSVTNGLPESSEVRNPCSCDSSEEISSQQPTSSVSHVETSDYNRNEASADEASNSNVQGLNLGISGEQDPSQASTSSVQQEVDEDVDFDDFGDFAGVDVEDTKTEVGIASEKKVQRPGSDCADSHRKDKEENQSSPIDDREDGKLEWNAFSAADESENDGWSADFGVFAEPKVENSSDVQPDIPPKTEICPALDEVCDSLDLWNVESEIGSDEAYDISVMLDADKPPTVGNDAASFNRSFHLWLALRIVEDALALKFEWKGSGHGENLFRTLSVDPAAVGRGTLPALSTSAVLEPTPFTANGTTRRSVIISREEGAHGAKVFTSDVAVSALQSKNPPAVVESPSFPQADFDWDKSGLTNPTKAANRSSALLDVDFLSANSGGGSSSTISTLQKELDQLGLSNSSVETLKKPSSQPSMLDMLMASSTKSDRRVNRPPSELSLDARALHDQLPDIEFLRANMIMFPLGEARCSQR